MRAYTVATAATTLGVSAKRLDNVLSRFPIQGVLKTRQGVNRRLQPRAIVSLWIANELARTAGIPLQTALALAEGAGNTEGIAAISLFSGAILTIDFAQISNDTHLRLAHAVEITPLPKRGRPSMK